MTDQRSLPGEGWEGWALRASKSTGEPARGQTIRMREAVPEDLRCPPQGSAASGTSGSNGLTAGTTRGEDVEGEGDGSTSSWQVTPRAEK